METISTDTKPKVRRGWVRHLKAFGVHVYISSIRLKARPKRDDICRGYCRDKCLDNKVKLYERQQHKCPHCGQVFDFEQLELHHILPVARFPELRQSIRNGILLCTPCHKEVHLNQWRNIAMMVQKAAELDINLTEHYELQYRRQAAD